MPCLFHTIDVSTDISPSTIRAAMALVDQSYEEGWREGAYIASNPEDIMRWLNEGVLVRTVIPSSDIVLDDMIKENKVTMCGIPMQPFEDGKPGVLSLIREETPRFKGEK